MYQISSKLNKILENALKISFTPSSNSGFHCTRSYRTYCTRSYRTYTCSNSIKWKLYFDL